MGERKEGGKNSRQRQRPVRTPRGKRGMVSSKTSGQLPKVHLRNVGRLEAAVVLKLQQMLVWKVDFILEPEGCH